MEEIYQSAFGIQNIRGINCIEACILQKSNCILLLVISVP